MATEAELAALEAVEQHGSQRAAAAALGLSHDVIGKAVRRVRKRALDAAGAKALPGMYVSRVSTNADGEVTAVRHSPDAAGPEPSPPPGHVVRGVSVLTDGAGRELARWTKTRQEERDRWEAFSNAVRELALEVPRAPAAAAPPAVDDDLVTWLPWGDPHLGMLSWATETGDSWDLKIAEEITAQVMADLISRTPRSGTFVLADLGDLFHAEDDKQQTPTAGHKLDVDSRAGKIARVALRVCETTIDLALNRHGRVQVNLLRGNHDPYKAIALGIWLEARYANDTRVEVAPFENPYQFWQWGANAVMLHHGDGSKPQQMPEIFACDPSWSECERQARACGEVPHRYVYTGHIHSQHRWDFRGCTVESFRTLAPADYWAHWRGYRSQRTLDAITLHRTMGEVSRVQQGIRRR